MQICKKCGHKDDIFLMGDEQLCCDKCGSIMEEITDVIFKKTKDNETIAFFPYVPTNYGEIMSYMHIGQHSNASYEFYLDCKPAKQEEYKQLYNELTNIVGYNLNIIKRINHDKFTTR